ncbi:MAG: type 2 isopentenyl-diphosphate Delta-isomerase [Ignavibacteria bacterium GWA2_55_11]|nr:MAG: type 2 isopentenyl-diphosphate Delta-isomerase [Ignavibacteria bacterium GWA2_55_11]OGU46354.1 MAG: type 2 isopentenyl-diphosphate Delta-isomerase [Ignavibacteria bacterium GWC2_56_12]OGU65888.1 MAG: type 2 isopentenyl-diphosphate Delta-isomerase [Ignavibacteria bacterium RIFCSPHIGHO2_02_FULL_56_12]OGU70878.1 MAG: type 2 isopentenyl-diphosphate Delta-isomerase [Ignavibacteria bacterium RIFCSPLOWO2_12_FULL_56_21]OGU73330.1 MAG: type 2 isopentenyl-diphosphate Delta-isomerase [Ignavibacter
MTETTPCVMRRTRTSSRKQQHVALTLRQDVGFRTTLTGFERWEFVHNALPELDLADVDPSTTFLGKRLRVPLIVSSMTGGYADALRINRDLARVCASRGLAMGVGSQRQALEDKRFVRSYAVVREVAPDIPVFGNIGAAEVAKLADAAPVQRLSEIVHADAFAVHLNPLQEFLQPEGTPAFAGVLKGISMLVRNLQIPVIVKEIGAGLSAGVIRRLLDVGVSVIDIAGAGGTSWAGVEILRRPDTMRDPMAVFWDWGIPTVDALRQAAAIKDEGRAFTLISSGGITNGLDMAKSIAFGADVTGGARPLLQALDAGGIKGLERTVDAWTRQFTGAMFLTGSRTVADLRRQLLVLKG